MRSFVAGHRLLPLLVLIPFALFRCALGASDYTFTDTNSFFSDTYAEADDKFRFVCTKVAGELNLRTYTHPTLNGKQGEALMSRVCLLGPEGAPSVLYSLTGVHGAEGFSGSAAMLKFMLEMNTAGSVYQMPPNTRYVLHHMVEPWGASWGFKENEDNVDQLKNSNDLYDPSAGWDRDNPIFIEVIDALDIPHLDQYQHSDPPFAVPLQHFQQTAAKYGEAFGVALRKGQMQRQVGMSYWGKSRSWSSTVQRQVAADHLAGAAKIMILDLHTAVGEYGKWTLYAYDLHSEAVFQEWIALAGVNKTMENLNLAGVSLDPWPFYDYVEKIVPSSEVVRVVWEAGTYPQEQYQLYLVLGMHCRFFPPPHNTTFTEEQCASFSQKISQYFYPNFDDFKQVAMEDLEVTSKALFAGMRSWFTSTSTPPASTSTPTPTASNASGSRRGGLGNWGVAGVCFLSLTIGVTMGYWLVQRRARKSPQDYSDSTETGKVDVSYELLLHDDQRQGSDATL